MILCARRRFRAAGPRFHGSRRLQANPVAQAVPLLAFLGLDEVFLPPRRLDAPGGLLGAADCPLLKVYSAFLTFAGSSASAACR